MMLKKGAIALALLVLAAPFAGQAQEDKPVYYYCFIGKPPYGNPLFFSETFSAKLAVDDADIRLSFASYIAARHEPSAMAGALCMRHDTMREAADALNDHIAKSRRDGVGVVVTNWRFSSR
jgi:hypothetical protein